MNKVVRGRDGRDGRDGLPGTHGRSAYDMAVEAGYSGSLKLFLEQIVGRDALTDGEGIYESAVANGYRGSYEKLIELLQGPKGDKGDKGDPGEDGRSAYEVAVANGFKGSEAQWLRSLKGKDGEDGERGPKGEQGERGPAGPAGTVSGGGGGSIYAKGIRLADAGGYFPEKNVEAALQQLGAGGGGGGAVDSVNGQTGVVVLSASDVGADASGAAAAAQAAAEAYADDLTAADVGADPAGSAAAAQVAAATDATTKANAAQAAAQTYADGKVLDSIADADTTHAPSRNAVFDALALKADLVGGVIPSAQIPAIAITEYLGSVASQAAMLALSGQKGDWALRSDLGTTWIITGNNPTLLADWTQLNYPTAPVTSVNGQTGAVSLAKGDVGLGNVDNTSDANKPVSTAQQTALNLKANLASPTFTGTVAGITAAMVGAPAGSGTSTGTNTGDQTSIVGITGTKAQFDTAVTDDNFAYVGTANSFTQGQTITPAVNASALTVATQTHTTSAPALNIAQTWNAAGVVFTGIKVNITNTASANGSLVYDFQFGGVSVLKGTKDGDTTIGRILIVAGAQQFTGNGTWSGSALFGFTSGAASGSLDASLARAGVNAIAFGPGTGAGSATSRTELNKSVTAIANATATDILTGTVPNGAHSFQIYLEVCGSLGAGGAIGANEATATNCYTITGTRTAGVNLVVAISAASGASAANVAGAATVTCTVALSAVAGAVGAANTFTAKVTISRSGGASTNHTCLVYAKLMNANATGVTIA